MARIEGTTGADDLSGNDEGDLIYGYGGNDDISGNGGDDLLFGGTGDDYLWGGEGYDIAYGGSGRDFFIETEGGDEFYGGNGLDTVHLSYGTFFGGGLGPIDYTFDPSGGSVVTPMGNTAYSVERIDVFGSDYNDTFTGWKNADLLRGWKGNDILNGEGGDDFLIGDNGDDTLYGGKGDDLITGNGNSDVLYGGRGNDTLIGGRFSDLFTGNDVMEGGPGADTFLAGPGRTDLLFIHSTQGVYVDMLLHIGFGGDAQGDVYENGIAGQILGSEFNDMMVGGLYMFGNGGDDRLVAHYGTRQLEGGDGVDTFVFRYNTDYIIDTPLVSDFDQAAHERIDVTGIDARGQPGDQAFKFIGTDAFSGKAGELRYEYDADNDRTVIQMNNDLDAEVDITLWLSHSYTLVAGDFGL